ncbi:MAG: D-glycerate dehydrogenase [Tepidisphaera sp.]|nr:D-glycerate dehydrogenase [Tepidisphaera sp.]
MIRICVCRHLPGELDLPDTELISNECERAFLRDELLSFVSGANILVTWVSERVDDELLKAAGEGLKAVCNFAVGTDNIDLAACKKRGIIVTNTPDAVTEGTADMAWTLMLAAARGLIAADRFARSAEYGARGPLGPNEFLGLDIAGRTLHIVGAGRIGFATALRSLGWGMKILYTARTPHPAFEFAPLNATRVSLEEGLAKADYISLHTPLTPETRGLINAKNLAIVKPGAVLINTSRGPVVQEQALVDALKGGRLAAAGLDVFEQEPKVHPDLISMTNVVLSPHIGSASRRSRGMMVEIVRANAMAIIAGGEPPNRVV